MNVPNTLTALRIAFIPALVVVFYLPFGWTNVAATALFALAGVTDWLDGYLARKLGQTSAFGAFLDPVADKLMVAVALVLLVGADPTPWLAIPAAVIIGREVAISALREWMAVLGERTKVSVAIVGKAKTVIQMLAIAFLLYREPLDGLPVYQVGFTLLYIAAVLTLWSMAAYLRAAWPVLFDNLRDTSHNAPGASIDSDPATTKIPDDKRE